jgi:hypothetical protein
MNFKNRFFEANEIKPNLFEYTIFAVEPTNQELNEWIAFLEKLIVERKRVASIYQLANMKFLKAEHRIAIGNWTKKQVEVIKETTIGVGYKTDGVLGKIVLNGIFLIQKPVYPTLISTKDEEIMSWIEELMAKEK